MRADSTCPVLLTSPALPSTHRVLSAILRPRLEVFCTAHWSFHSPRPGLIPWASWFSVLRVPQLPCSVHCEYHRSPGTLALASASSAGLAAQPA